MPTNTEKLDGMCPTGKAVLVGTRLNEVIEAAQELHDDHATSRTVDGDLKTAVNANITLLTEIKTQINALLTFMAADGIINPTVLGIHSTPEEFINSEFDYQIDGVDYNKAAATAHAFSAADTINTGAAAGTFWGVWAVQIDAAGAVTTKSPAADQTYGSEADAVAALPAADANTVVIGYICIECNDTASWTAITDDMTPASDCVSANFYAITTDIPAALASAVASAVASSPPAALTATKPADL